MSETLLLCQYSLHPLVYPGLQNSYSSKIYSSKKKYHHVAKTLPHTWTLIVFNYVIIFIRLKSSGLARFTTYILHISNQATLKLCPIILPICWIFSDPSEGHASQAEVSISGLPIGSTRRFLGGLDSKKACLAWWILKTNLPVPHNYLIIFTWNRKTPLDIEKSQRKQKNIKARFRKTKQDSARPDSKPSHGQALRRKSITPEIEKTLRNPQKFAKYNKIWIDFEKSPSDLVGDEQIYLRFWIISMIYKSFRTPKA